MAREINRNPWEMQRYAKDLEKSIETIRDEINRNRSIMKMHVEKMDSNCKKAVEKFDTLNEALEKQLKEYERLAEMLKKNAQALIDAYDHSGF